MQIRTLFFLSQQLFNKLVLLLKQIQDNIMSTKALYRKVHIYINGKEIESTIGSLKTALGDLKREQKTMTIGSEEYIKTSLKMKEIESVIKDQERAVKDLGDSWNKNRTKMADISNMIMGFQSVFEMFDSGIGKVKDLAADAAALDDVYADVQKTTGLTHEEVEKLNEAFKKMDTRTSREQLNQLAYDTAKLDKKNKSAIIFHYFLQIYRPQKDFF